MKDKGKAVDCGEVGCERTVGPSLELTHHLAELKGAVRVASLDVCALEAS